jgi:hypothetical protein
MPRDGSGNFTLPYPSFQANSTIVSGEVNQNNTHIADALTQSLARDGQSVPTANLPMGGFRLTGLGAGSGAADSVHLRQVQYQAWMWAGTAGGSGGSPENALTLSPAPAIGAYAAGQAFRFKANATNSASATVNVSSLGDKAIQNNGNALTGGEIVSNKLYEIVYDGAQFQLNHITVGDPFSGPVSSTDNALVRWDGLDGRTVQDSAILIDDNNRLLSHASDGAVIGGVRHSLNNPPSDDFDSTTGVGWYLGTASSTANMPDGAVDWIVLVTGDSSFIRQVAWRKTDVNLVHTRIYSGSWSAWVQLITDSSGGTLKAGFDATEYDAGTQSSGTFTPDPANGNFQKAVNGGAHTLAPPGKTCTMVIQYTNNGSAGAIATSGFTVVDGDAFTTTDGHDFLFYITEVNGFSRLTVSVLQ